MRSVWVVEFKDDNGEYYFETCFGRRWKAREHAKKKNRMFRVSSFIVSKYVTADTSKKAGEK